MIIMCKDKPITQQLRELEVGGILVLPIEKKSMLSTTIYGHLAPERARGVRFTTSTDYNNSTVTVTRTA